MLSLTPKQVLYLGFVATAFNAVSQIPQVILTFSNKNLEAVSLSTNILIVIAQFMWILYGYYVYSIPLIVSSSIVGILCLIIIIRVLLIRNDTNIHSASVMISDFDENEML